MAPPSAASLPFGEGTVDDGQRAGIVDGASRQKRLVLHERAALDQRCSSVGDGTTVAVLQGLDSMGNVAVEDAVADGQVAVVVDGTPLIATKAAKKDRGIGQEGAIADGYGAGVAEPTTGREAIAHPQLANRHGDAGDYAKDAVVSSPPPESDSRSRPGPCTLRFLSMMSCDDKMIVEGAGRLNVMVSPEFALATAWRKLPAPVSAVEVTTMVAADAAAPMTKMTIPINARHHVGVLDVVRRSASHAGRVVRALACGAGFLFFNGFMIFPE